jgi:hypothetical protein
MGRLHRQTSVDSVESPNIAVAACCTGLIDNAVRPCNGIPRVAGCANATNTLHYRFHWRFDLRLTAAATVPQARAALSVSPTRPAQAPIGRVVSLHDPAGGTHIVRAERTPIHVSRQGISWDPQRERAGALGVVEAKETTVLEADV